MNFDEIKNGFLEYYINKQQENGKKLEDIKIENINLFSHFADFKKYLVEENIADTSIFSKSIKDIQSMQLVNGKLTVADDKKTDKADEKDSSKDNIKEDDIMLSMLNDLISDEAMINSLDTNKSKGLDIKEIQDFLVSSDTDNNNSLTFGELSEGVMCKYMLDVIYSDSDTLKYLNADKNNQISDEEKEMFEAYIKADKKNLTSEDVQKAYNSIKDGTFDIEAYEKFKQNYKLNNDIKETKENEKPKEASQPSSVSGGGGGGNYNSSYTPQNTNTKKQENDPLNLNGKTAEELQKISSDKKKEIQNNYDNLKDVYSGNSEQLKTLQENCDKAEAAYENQLEAADEKENENIKKERELDKNIDDTQKEIDETDISIVEAQGKLTTIESNLSNHKAELSILKAAQAEIPQSGKTEEQSQDYESKKAEIQQRIDTLNEQIEKEEQEKTAQQDVIKQYEEKKKELEDKKSGFEKEREEVLKLIDNDESISEDTKELLKDYNASKDALKKQKQTEINALNKVINDEKTQLKTIDAKYQEVKAKETKKEFSTEKPLFDEDVQLKSQYIDNGETMPYMAFLPEPYDPDKEYPVIFYLHGSYQFEHQGRGIMDETMPAVFSSENLGNFDGIVICPHAEDYNGWDNKAANALRGLVDYVKENYSVDENRIALTGGSLGAMAVERYAQDMSDIFCKGATISSFNTGVDVNNLDMPLMAYTGTTARGERADSVSYVQSKYQNYVQVDANHCSSPIASFGYDANGNGYSDLIEWLFDGEDK